MIANRAIALAALMQALVVPAAWATIPGDIAPPSAPPIAWPAGPGKVLVETRCLICHQGELIASQRLTPTQWGKEVDKMAKWGSPLSPTEKGVLAAYLAKHYPVGAPAAKPVLLSLPAATP